MKFSSILRLGAAGLAGVAIHDLTQKKHTLKRNFPVLANARYGLEKIGPELRQYIVTDNDQERPFNRDQRSWIYASAKGEDVHVGFGTDNDVEHQPGYPIFKHRTFPLSLPTGTESIPAAKILGGPRGRRHAFRPESIINISAMSFGALSGAAITALNRGAATADCLHNTGEGGISSYHRSGADLIYQLGTGYFGARDLQGNFSLPKFLETVASAPVRAIEIKISQGAKPGLGGLLPAAKVTAEIAEIRGIPVGKDCASPPRHSAFKDVDSMLDFVEMLAAETGLPIGIKSAVGDLDFWEDLAELMQSQTRGVDFITIDGGEGGTGAALPIFTDAVSLPFRMGFSRVYQVFARRGLTDQVLFIGSAKNGLPENAVVGFGLGLDMVNVGREALFALGCIQAQKCHTDRCPTGITTHSPWLVHGLDVADKSTRVANYLTAFREELLKVTAAIGVAHPGLITPSDIEIFQGNYQSSPLAEVYGYQPGWGELGAELAHQAISLT